MGRHGIPMFCKSKLIQSKTGYAGQTTSAVDAPAFINQLELSSKFVQKDQMDTLRSVHNFESFGET